MSYDGNPPARVDALWYIYAALGNVERRASRAGADGSLDPTWATRIRSAIDHARELCLLARVDGAVLPVRPEIEGASVELSGLEHVERIEAAHPQPLPTEAAHAREPW